MTGGSEKWSCVYPIVLCIIQCMDIFANWRPTWDNLLSSSDRSAVFILMCDCQRLYRIDIPLSFPLPLPLPPPFPLPTCLSFPFALPLYLATL